MDTWGLKMSGKTVLFGVVCIVLIAGLVGVFAYYWMQVNALNDEKNALTNYKSKLETWLAGNITQLQSQYQDYASTHNHTDSEYSSLESAYNSLRSTFTSLQSQYDSMKNERDSLKLPKLIKVNFGASDNRPWFGTPYLNINGVLINVGSNTAYTCRLHVILYQSGGVTAKDTYINLGSINGESWTNVNTNVYYEGSGLTTWSITPEWTS
jgi:uncharacterized membrane-anchored protein YhcB (DUF1043 family)